MKKALYIFISTFFVLVSAKAEEMVTDSLEVSQEVEEPKSIYCWTYSDAIGTEQVGGIDTSMNDFYVNNKAFREI